MNAKKGQKHAGSSLDASFRSEAREGTNIWSRLLARGASANTASLSADSFADEERAAPAGCAAAAGDAALASRFAARAFLATLRRRPVLPLAALAAFALGAALGLGLVRAHGDAYKQGRCQAAANQATAALDWFADEFEKSLAPLFALAQVVKHDEGLCELSNRIGERGAAGAAPGWPEAGKELLLRDVRGVCDDPALQDRFAGIAESVKKDSGLGSVITGLRVAPAGVMCMIHPVVNYDDYAHVETNATTHIAPYYNGTSRLYNDWAWDKPRHIDVLRRTLQVQEARENRITVTGPFKMKSAGGDGNVLTETLFCTHLGVSVPNHTMTMVGEGKDDPPASYNSWGFVMGFVNWQYMVDQSRIGERFRDAGLVYMLNRTFEYEDREGGGRKVQTDRIAWSHERCVTTTEEDARIEVSKSVNGDAWTLLAGYTSPARPAYEVWAQLAVVLTSAVISVLVLSTLVKNQQHKELLYKMMPKQAIRKLNRGQTVVEKYSCVTIFFSDIVGFTSMAGKMRPIEVMDMLNALYVEFDKLCEKHRCYKVETIGDAYMVVGGAPDRCSRPEAAKKVAAFALDALGCVENFRTPDGSTINIRAGMASGPVVAGVVGSVMPRYCLFGDTVNLASRMESTSKQDKIQACDLTADLLHESFRLEERRDSKERAGIMVKGKGWTETCWLMGPLGGDMGEPLGKAHKKKYDSEACRAVPLELDILSTDKEAHLSSAKAQTEQNWAVLGQDLHHSHSDTNGWIERVVTLLEHRLLELISSRSGSDTQVQEALPKDICQELRSLVFKISSLYNDVQFHNFEHACHVTMSINELLNMSTSTRSRINYQDWYWSNEMVCFAMVFAALIHDVGHLGMTNKMLVDQEHILAKRYNNKSVAESNSIDVAIDMFINGDFPCLRASVFRSKDEMEAFLMLVRVAVSATDIASKDNMDECKELLSCAFDIHHAVGETGTNKLEYHASKMLTAHNLDANNFDAAFKVSLCRNFSLLQLLIQAADIAHSVQSFEISLRWNYRLFKELHACYSSHLLPVDPGDFWATGELGFFDGYVQPLTARLCQITCPDSDEMLMLSRFAKENADQWKTHGKIISEIMAKGVALGQDEENTIDSILHVRCSVVEK